VYKDFFTDGTLQKAVSPAATTTEFLFRVFKKKHDDIVYVSGNVFINSKGIPLSDYDFNAKEYFKNIIDVWYFGWSEKYGTVHPSEMNRNAIVALDIHPTKRIILHYMQPHYPYLCYGGDVTQQKINNHNTSVKKSASRIIHNSSLMSKFNRFIYRNFKEETIWKVARFCGKTVNSGIARIWLEHGRDGILNGYMENIRIVLIYVKQLVERYPDKRFLIISDHGEWLGEKGLYGHFKSHLREPPTLCVPWFEVGGRR